MVKPVVSILCSIFSFVESLRFHLASENIPLDKVRDLPELIGRMNVCRN